jgi:hypothetical protein
MAKIWPVYEGREPTVGGPWAELPVSQAISVFELDAGDFVSDLSKTPRFGRADQDLRHIGYKHIVVEIGRNEARQTKLKPGYYHSPVKPKEAFDRLIEEALVTELGTENVVRVESETGIDSQDQGALKVTVVIAPGATEKIAKGASLDALVRLQERLKEMRETRTPIIEYATEAELRQDAGP